MLYRQLFILQLFLLSMLTCVAVITSEKFIEENHTQDIELYYSRAKTIIEGGILYKDVHTETPPIVNYLLVAPYLMGGEVVSYCIFFSMTVVITTYLIYHFLSKIDECRSLYSAMLFGLSPVVLVIPTILKDDEAMTVLFFILPLLMMMANYKKFAKLATFIISIGIWVKIFPIIVAFSKIIREKQKVFDALVYTVVSIAVCSPFIVLTGSEFIWFLKFYFLGTSFAGEGSRVIKKGLEGQSFWRLLDYHGITVPDIIPILIFAVFSLVVAYFSYKKKFNPWKISLLILLLFFIFYPKIHTPYYIYLFAVLTPYALDKLRSFILLNLLILLTHAYKFFVIDLGWIDKNILTSLWGFSASVATLFLLVYLFIQIYNEKSWIDKRFEEMNLSC